MPTLTLLPLAEWRALAAAHEARVDDLVADHLARRSAGERHPVHDFLFTYYSYRPAQLRAWAPGFGVELEGAENPASAELLAQRLQLLRQTRSLLAATLARPPHLGCFGMHEWAMVYRLDSGQTRHSALPLRLGPAGTDSVVEGHRIACSHFDAYRFFTPQAQPLNTLSPTAADRPAYEQPACLHAGMDLYKHAFRLAPLVPSELVVDAFELARDIRVLDMRASPYDLSSLGYEPVRVETAEGKQDYAAAQSEFAERGRPLREALLDWCEELLR